MTDHTASVEPAVEPQRVAVVGAATEIGCAVVAALCGRGLHVAALDVNSRVYHLGAEYSRVVDISDFPAVEDALQLCANALGGLDAVVTVTGIAHRGTVDAPPPSSGTGCSA